MLWASLLSTAISNHHRLASCSNCNNQLTSPQKSKISFKCLTTRSRYVQQVSEATKHVSSIFMATYTHQRVLLETATEMQICYWQYALFYPNQPEGSKIPVVSKLKHTINNTVLHVIKMMYASKHRPTLYIE